MKNLRSLIKAVVIALYIAAANPKVQAIINHPSTADAVAFGAVKLLG